MQLYKYSNSAKNTTTEQLILNVSSSTEQQQSKEKQYNKTNTLSMGRHFRDGVFTLACFVHLGYVEYSLKFPRHTRAVLVNNFRYYHHGNVAILNISVACFVKG